MCVPCPNVSSAARSRSEASSEKSGPCTTRPGAASDSTGITPESITATSTPEPSGPAIPARPAPPERRASEAATSVSAALAAGASSAVNMAVSATKRPAGRGFPGPSQRIPNLILK